MEYAGRKILIVDDESIIAESTRIDLEAAGYRASYVRNAHAAVEAVRGDPELSLVLMDIELGDGIDGAEAARRILDLRRLPVLFFSSHTDASVIEKTELVASYGFVQKSSGTPALLASIKMAYRLFDAHADRDAKSRLLQAVVDNAAYPIWAKDLEGRFILASRLLAESMGKSSADELLGRTCHELQTKEIADEQRANDLAVVWSGKPIVTDEIGEGPDGVKRYVTTKYPLKDDSGRIYGVGGACVEIAPDSRGEGQGA
jgi:CheY-like chemotaxis protein